MVIIDHYIRRALLMGIFLTMMVLLPLIGFLLFGDELDYVGVGSYGLTDAFIIMALSMPRYAHRVFPIVGLIGSLLGLGGLASHNELNAMRSAGVSIARIVWAVVKAGFIAAIFAVLLGELIAPACEEMANNLRASLLSKSTAAKTIYGFWAKDGNTFVNIRQVLPEGRLRDLYIYEFNAAQQLKRSTYANSAFYTGHDWTLEGVSQSIITDTEIKIQRLAKMDWASLLDPWMLSLLVIDPHVLPVWSLYSYMNFMRSNGLDTTSYQVIFWGKIATPLVIIVMTALAVPLLFGSLRKIEMGQRMFTGILIGVAFYVFDTVSTQFAVVFGLQPMLAVFIPSLLCISVVLWIVQHSRH